MDLSHAFTVPASVEDSWATFLDLETVAGCFPGASLTSVEGDEFKGSCKVKLGPISLVYAGSGKFVERDESAHRFVIEAKGKDKRGNGTAGATVTAVLTSGDSGGASTNVEVATDLSVTGKPAQFGRGLMQDVSDKLLQQFVTCLESMVGRPAATSDAASANPSDAAAATPSDAAATTPSDAAAATSDAAAATSDRAGNAGPTSVPASRDGVGAPRRAPVSTPASPRDSDDALDLGATVLPVLIRSYGKQVAVVLAVLLALKLLLRRRRR